MTFQYSLNDFLSPVSNMAIRCCGKNWNELLCELNDRGIKRFGYEQVPLKDCAKEAVDRCIIYNFGYCKCIHQITIDDTQRLGYDLIEPAEILLPPSFDVSDFLTNLL